MASPTNSRSNFDPARQDLDSGLQTTKSKHLANLAFLSSFQGLGLECQSLCFLELRGVKNYLHGNLVLLGGAVAVGIFLA